MTYSSAVSVRRQKFSTRGQNAVSFRTNSKRLGPVSNMIVLLVVICLLGLVYLTQVTKTNAYSYQTNVLEQRRAALIEEQKDLEQIATRLSIVDETRLDGANQELVSASPIGAIQPN